MTALAQTGADFSQFSMLYLDESGRFIDPEGGSPGETRLIAADELPVFLKRSIALPAHVTDVFVWVHGWQNDELRAAATAKRLFANLKDWFTREHARYPHLGTVVPGFVAVHWPSSSLPTLSGYTKIRDRAKRMTTEGEAEFFPRLASRLPRPRKRAGLRPQGAPGMDKKKALDAALSQKRLDHAAREKREHGARNG